MENEVDDQHRTASPEGSEETPSNEQASIFSGLYRKATVDRLHESEGALDPANKHFDPWRYGRKLLNSMDAQGIALPRIGVTFQDLSASGSGAALQYQQDVLSIFTAVPNVTRLLRRGSAGPKKTIISGFNGQLVSGELLLVLGRPGSGCSTFLKTLCGSTNGLSISPDSKIDFSGISKSQMAKEYRGFVTYNSEVDQHFPHLTVGQTFEFAAASRAPHLRIGDVSRQEYIETSVQITMALFGLSHTYDTKVGSDFVRGVSGGERKRVSIGEMALSRARVGAWDNSTRGLDSATALSFVKALRLFADLGGACHLVAAYQASQAMYETFDKVIVLYSGRQVFFGSCKRALKYFEEMGWQKPTRQAIPDFLTAVTNPAERIAREGMTEKVPRTADDFEQYWKRSADFAALRSQLLTPKESNSEAKLLQTTKNKQQAKHVRPKSPFIISVPMQIRLCIKRAYQRLWNEKSSTISTVASQVILSLIIGSIFYGTPAASAGFFQKGAVLFFAILMNALISINEITLLYSQRPIVEKQASYAFVHPFAEAFATMISDLPIKMVRCSVFSIILYFMVNLRREPSQFFIFYLFLIIGILTMSSIFRTLAAATKTIGQAMAFAGVLVIMIVVYAGFTLPQPYMHPWFAWIRWLNPIFYVFESLISNEFHGRHFECSEYIPNYAVLTGDSFICSVLGAKVGERFVSGDSFIQENYNYRYSHTWRNFGIVLVFWILFTFTYLFFSEYNSGITSKADFLVFRRGHAPDYIKEELSATSDEEKTSTKINDASHGLQITKSVNHLPEQRDILTWKNLCYEVPTKEGTRRLLDNVAGWVKPGTLTALMGVSGAGKTTLLDVIADRASVGIVTGDIFVSGKPRAADFQRQTGYVQQQDLHLATTTVREALQFSAMLRQPKTVSREEKNAYVEEVVKMLGMDDFAEAVIGQPGQGLNVEQRKLLSIGVELAAKPALLLFLDEPTSGLDSQSSWAICKFLRTLADHGQAILCTIHQPSALLFQEFDRLLLLDKGGKTAYFGDIGKQSRTLISYFERNGARHCDLSENPAEYMLEVLGKRQTNDGAGIDWPTVWNGSAEAEAVREELSSICERLRSEPSRTGGGEHTEFAMPLITQIKEVTYRAFQQNYRSPEYIYSRFLLGIVSALFIGFSFWMPDSSTQGFQNVLFALFLLCSIMNTLVNQLMPKFIAQRDLYEVREQPSKTYSWKAFILAQIFCEIPWQVLLGILAWMSFYWSVLGAHQSGERRGLILLFLIQFYLFAASFAHLVISAMPDAATGGMIATLCFGLTLIFNGVMQPPKALPGFWIFMYYISPLTYYIQGLAATALHGRPVTCSDAELSVFNPPSGQTCGQYLEKYLAYAPGQLYNSDATSGCQYCSISSADQYLAAREIEWSNRWRNYGIFWAYFLFNICGAVLLYYLCRVKKWRQKKFAKQQKKA
ncbi:ABC-2 type transporter-domain-containing protein [Exophiala viscosa]|uniref:ABC-2 type transporter-domain-containing protein n=1 Tax=Exophiala viscosa TaxID=2486360 RepID=UPI00219D299D|nr:ABC-2 type transporter-domain-containing protein [Exophiala viscosa]